MIVFALLCISLLTIHVKGIVTMLFTFIVTNVIEVIIMRVVFENVGFNLS